MPPLFASIELAARIERADCRLLADVAAAVRCGGATDVLAQPIAGGIATYTTDDSPLNKLAGLGFGGVPSEDALAEVERFFERRGAPLKTDLPSLGEPGVGELLMRRGYVLRGFENVLGRPLAAADPLPASPEVEVRLAGEDEFRTWLDIIVDGFASPDEQGVPSHETFPREPLEAAVRAMIGAGGFALYLARLDGRPAGAASMRVVEDVAQLTGAATLPAHRRRGVQTALLARRLADATSAGADVAVVTTQPGSRSCQNVQRQGFDLLYARAVLERAPAG